MLQGRVMFKGMQDTWMEWKVFHLQEHLSCFLCLYPHHSLWSPYEAKKAKCRSVINLTLVLSCDQICCGVVLLSCAHPFQSRVSMMVIHWPFLLTAIQSAYQVQTSAALDFRCNSAFRAFHLAYIYQLRSHIQQSHSGVLWELCYVF